MKILEPCIKCGLIRLVDPWRSKQPSYTGMCNNCARHSRRGENNPRWKGGTTFDSRGYRFVRLYPEDLHYSMATFSGGCVYEHRLVMAKHLGRCLKSWEIVHHINGVKDDNRLENLTLINSHSHGKKTLIHLLQERIRELEQQ